MLATFSNVGDRKLLNQSPELSPTSFVAKMHHQHRYSYRQKFETHLKAQGQMQMFLSSFLVKKDQPQKLH